MRAQLTALRYVARARRPAPALAAAGLALLGLALVVGPPRAWSQVETARLGAALAILADGSPPWEDRPLMIAGSGLLTGTAGVADPGDDLGAEDGVVRTYDSVAVRLSYDVLDRSARRLVLEATLSPELIWQAGEESRLSREGCPGGARVDGGRQVLTCVVGDVPVPPALTGVVDAVARVRGRAPNGASATVSFRVSATNGRPDPDPVRCPGPLANGCQATGRPLRVSAALAMETRKRYDSYDRAQVVTRDGVRGWQVPWDLRLLAGGDGDPRGDTGPAPEAVMVHDWWRATTPAGAVVDLGGELVDCDRISGAAWTCAQPGGPGSPVEVTLASVDPDAFAPTQDGNVITDRKNYLATVARARLRLFFPMDRLAAAGGRARLENCFATRPGEAQAAEFAPRDVVGNPNLGGLPEPLADNCALVDLVVPSAPQPGAARGPRLEKLYWPGSDQQLEEVVAEEEIGGEVSVYNDNDEGGLAFGEQVLCDLFDNSSQRLDLREAFSRPAAAYVIQVDETWPNGSPLPDDAVVLEFATGPWGLAAPAGASRGQAWYAQANTACTDRAPVNPAGWVSFEQLDFGGGGGGLLDAAEVNMVRARLRDPQPPGSSRLLRTHLEVLPNPAGTLLINYGATYNGSAPRAGWMVSGCYSQVTGRCPDPPAFYSFDWNPGSYGDARILVDAPTLLRKRVEGATQTLLLAGSEGRYRLEAYAGRDADYPLTREVTATRVIVTDIVPAGLSYVPGSATRAAEDVNRNGRLEPDEDVNGNGLLDAAAPAPPVLYPDSPVAGASTLVWELGDILSLKRPAVLDYRLRLAKLIPGGRSLANRAFIRAQGEAPADCPASGSGRYPDRCAHATVTVLNTSRAAVAKTAVEPQIAAGAALHFKLQVANLTRRPIEWLDAVDILPHEGDGRDPASRLTAPWRAITATTGTGPTITLWASAVAPLALDTAAGGLPDGVMDPVTAYGDAGAGLGGPDWPCLLAEVGTPACPEIAEAGAVTALRIWAPDPDPTASGDSATSLLPVDEDPRDIELWLLPAASRPGDVFHNAWGGRFEGLVLPAFDAAVARVPVPRLYLPYLGREEEPACKPRPLSLALVLDTSTSMLRPSGLGGTKQQAVQAAAGRLVDGLLGGAVAHEVAVVGFNDRAWIAQDRTSDPARVRAALAGLAADTAEGTRLDLGLAVGGHVLRGTPLDRRVMVFLTDGLPNRVPTPIPQGSQEDTVRQFAYALRGQGISFRAIGYGRPDGPDLSDRVSPELLADIAGSTGRSYIVPGAAELDAAFADIGADLACPRP